jgi:DNA-binding NarL/FixJ family response regulator
MEPSMNSPIRVLVADSEKIYREGLKVIFSRGNEVRVVGQACTGPEACEKARRIQPDLVLMEMNLPEMDGVTAVRHILAAQPEMRVAMLTSSRSDSDVMNAVKAGAHGYITKDISVGALVDSIRRVVEGEAVIPPSFASRLLQEYAALARGRDDEAGAVEADRSRVTEREREVLKLLVEGATNRDIARQLVITENTVKVHLRNILEKLHLRNRQQAAAFAISSGLVRLQPERNGNGSSIGHPMARPMPAGAWQHAAVRH